MATTLEIIRGISQAASNTHHGAIDDKGEPIKIGLRREEDIPLTDSRVMDGFKISFRGPILCIKYHSECQLKEVHQNGFENEVGGKIKAIAKFLKSEYKKATGSGLTLTAIGEPKVMVQNASRVRTWLQAYQDYNIGGIGEVEEYGHDLKEASAGRDVDDSIRKWLAIGKDKYPGTKKPQNYTAKTVSRPGLGEIDKG
jgi:hypothetical protein